MPIEEERFEYKGFPCVVLFQQMGFRTGYVGLPKDNKYYGKDYDDIPVGCHGGLTYADKDLSHQNDVDIWWIGFDCGHCCDGFDLEKLDKYYGDSVENKIMSDYRKMINEEHEFRTLEYVKENCMQIVDQLLKER